MDLEGILTTIQPFLVMFVALTAAFLTALWVSAVIWAFRDIRSRTRDIFAQILATLLVLILFPFFPLPGLVLYLILRPRETLAEVYERSLEEETLLQGIGERKACPTCNRQIDDDFVVCPACHTRLKNPCLACGRLLHLRWIVCPYCGAVQTKTEITLSSQPALEAGATAPMLAAAPQAFVPEVAAAAVPGSELDATAEAAPEGGAWPNPVPDEEADPEPEAEAEAEPDPEPEDEPLASPESEEQHLG